MLTKVKTSEKEVFDKVSTHRYSDQTKSTLMRTPQKEVSSFKKVKTRQTANLNPLTNADFVITEEYQWQENDQTHQNHLVLNIENE